jgi:molybdenum cofactor cytidylyltransferase
MTAAASGVVGILLAAGRGVRFGGDKLLARLGSEVARVGPHAQAALGVGEPPGVAPGSGAAPSPSAGRGSGVQRGLDGECVGTAACRNLLAALPRVIAVVRPDDGALAAALGASGARILRCARADEGMGASLSCGVASVPDARGWIIALADMPWVAPETIARVAAAIADGAPVAAPFHRGERGHPVGFGRVCYEALAALGGDEGAKSIIAAHRDSLARIDVDDPGILRDIDTPADLRSVRSPHS